MSKSPLPSITMIERDALDEDQPHVLQPLHAAQPLHGLEMLRLATEVVGRLPEVSSELENGSRKCGVSQSLDPGEFSASSSPLAAHTAPIAPVKVYKKRGRKPTPGLTEEDRRQARLLKNRRTAEMSRRRKMQFLHDLQADCTAAKKECARLTAENKRLRFEIERYKRKLEEYSIDSSVSLSEISGDHITEKDTESDREVTTGE